MALVQLSVVEQRSPWWRLRRTHPGAVGACLDGALSGWRVPGWRIGRIGRGQGRPQVFSVVPSTRTDPR